jgi:hypothetical protein
MFRKYSNGRTAIQLIDTYDNEPVCTASVNVEAPLNHDEVVIKNYSENEGVYEALLEAGIINEAHAQITVGYAGLQPIVTLKEGLSIE